MADNSADGQTEGAGGGVMDTSETYIKMCDCEEIQALADTDGFRSSDIRKNIYALKSGGFATIYVYKNSSNVWLPRQDQLQEMVCDRYRLKMPGFMVNDLSLWCGNNMLSQFTSMEQLWLAFVMKKKHNKVWTDSEWVEENPCIDPTKIAHTRHSLFPEEEKNG